MPRQKKRLKSEKARGFDEPIPMATDGIPGVVAMISLCNQFEAEMQAYRALNGSPEREENGLPHTDIAYFNY